MNIVGPVWTEERENVPGFRPRVSEFPLNFALKIHFLEYAKGVIFVTFLNRAVFESWLFFAITLCPFQAQGNRLQDTVNARTATEHTEKSSRHFVQTFYDWYVPRALSVRKGPASTLALKYKRSAFSPELYRALQEDSNAEAKVSGRGEIVAIDFDPFLFSQDPCEHYVVGSVSRKGESYWVDVYAVCSGKKSDAPDVVAELKLKDGRWYFTDFHRGKNQHAGDGSLLSALKEAREDREKHPE